MANVKIDDLAALVSPDATDVLPIVDVSLDVTKKVTVGEIVGKVSGDVDIATDGTSSIATGAIVDADVNASAAIAGTKIQAGTTSNAGAVQLEDSTASTSTTTAATPNAVKSAYDLADAALPKSGGTMTGDIVFSGTQTFPSVGTGTVTSVDVSGGTGLTSSGGPITSSGTIAINLDDTAVTPGSYTYASLTVDQQGRITAASNGTAPLTSSDIGVTVQGYDADTAKYDDTTANFTGTLQNGGSNVVVDSDIGVTVQGYDADTAKLDVAQTFTAQQTFGELKETVYTLGTSGSIALDPANGSIQSSVLAGAPTFTDSLEAGQMIVLMLENGASYTVTWPTITWVTSAGNTAPTLTAKDTLVLWKVSTTLYGAYVGSYV